MAMPLKVVPAGDERCDIHNGRSPASFVCEACLEEEFGVDPRRETRPARRRLRWRVRRAMRWVRSPRNRKVVVGSAIGLLVVAAIATTALSGGGGGGGSGVGGSTGPTNTGPTEEEVVKALGLVPQPGMSWATPDGACAVTSIDLGPDIQAGPIAGNVLVEAANQEGTVGAVVAQKDFSVSEAECVARITTALNARF